MLDIDKFIIELDRLITLVHFYDEVYCNVESVKTISNFSLEAAKIIQLSIHNDIIISTTRLLFDGKSYESHGKYFEYLSQYNLVTTYQDLIDEDLQLNRDKISELKQTLNLKNYRDLVIAHNNKAVLTGEAYQTKHQVKTETLLELLKESRILFIGIRLKIAKINGEKSILIAPNYVYRGGAGLKFIEKIRSVTNL